MKTKATIFAEQLEAQRKERAQALDGQAFPPRFGYEPRYSDNPERDGWSQCPNCLELYREQPCRCERGA